jgi:hypothetical protein
MGTLFRPGRVRKSSKRLSFASSAFLRRQSLSGFRSPLLLSLSTEGASDYLGSGDPYTPRSLGGEEKSKPKPDSRHDPTPDRRCFVAALGWPNRGNRP